MIFSARLRQAIGLAVLAAPLAQAVPGDTVSQIMAQAGSRNLLIIGEMHGVREGPELVTELAKRWAEPPVLAGKAPALVVALEYPQTESVQLKAYVDGDGGAAAAKQLLDSPFWSRAMQDGRSSEAMLALIEALRSQSRRGLDVKLVAFDMNANQKAALTVRDLAMADNLRAIVKANPGARVIVLTGNYHARQRDGAPWDTTYRFMAGYLRDLAPFSLNVDSMRGDYWTCSSPNPADCMVTRLASEAADSPPLGLHADQGSGYDQSLMLPRFSASPPARKAD